MQAHLSLFIIIIDTTRLGFECFGVATLEFGRSASRPHQGNGALLLGDLQFITGKFQLALLKLYMTTVEAYSCGVIDRELVGIDRDGLLFYGSCRRGI